MEPESDENYLEMLCKLAELGYPVAINQFARAAGVDLDKLLATMVEDQDLRRRLDELT